MNSESRFSALDAICRRLGEDCVRVSSDPDFPLAALVVRDEKRMLIVRAGQGAPDVEEAAAWALRDLDDELRGQTESDVGAVRRSRQLSSP